MSRTSRRERKRERKERFVRRFAKGTPNGCVSCALAALDVGFRCSSHPPLTPAERVAWRARHPSYVRLQEISERPLSSRGRPR